MGTAYVKQTWTDGVSSGSAARFAFMEQGIFDAQFQPCAHVTHGTAQAIATSTTTTLAFNTERYDTDTIHDTVTNNSRLTCRTAGKYSILGQVEFASNATGNRQVFIELNGGTVIGYVTQAALIVGLNTNMNVFTHYDMAVNDYVELMVWQSSGGALSVNATGNNSPEFMMARIG